MGDDCWWHDRISSPEFVRKMRGVAWSIIRDPPLGYDRRIDAVDDALQESLLHLWQTPPPDDVRDFDAWARRVAERKTLSFLRCEGRQTRNRQSQRPPGADEDDDYECGEEYFRPSTDGDPTSVACENIQLINEAFEFVVQAAEEHHRDPELARCILKAMMHGLSVVEIARDLHLTPHKVKNLKNRVIYQAFAEHFPEVMALFKRRGPKRGKKGKSGPRDRPPRGDAGGDDEDTGGDLFGAATTVAAHLAC